MIKLLIILLLFISQSAGAQLATGSGTIGDPYQIWYLEDLAAIETNQPAHFKMMTDLDFNDPASYESGVVNTDWTTGAGWSPFDVIDCVLDGNNKTIYNLYSSQSIAGLFDAYEATIATTSILLNDLTISGASVSGTQALIIRDLLNCAVSGIRYKDSTTTGTLRSGFFSLIDAVVLSDFTAENINLKTSGTSAAGISLMGTIQNSIASEISVASASIEVYSVNVGGVFGIVYEAALSNISVNNTKITNNYDGTQQSSTGGMAESAFGGSSINNAVLQDIEIFANAGRVAGAVPTSTGSTIASSSVRATISVATTIDTTEEYRGGLVGRISGGSINQCFSVATITATAGVRVTQGGLVGIIASTAQVTDSFSRGGTLIHGANLGRHGGFAGQINLGTSVTNSYAANTGTNLSGFVEASASAAVSDCYYDSDLAEVESPEATGKTTAEMYQQATFSGWDFNTVWGINEGAGYPYLLWSPPDPVLYRVRHGIGTLKFSTNGALKFGGTE